MHAEAALWATPPPPLDVDWNIISCVACANAKFGKLVRGANVVTIIIGRKTLPFVPGFGKRDGKRKSERIE